jgi:hypothetical protein
MLGQLSLFLALPFLLSLSLSLSSFPSLYLLKCCLAMLPRLVSNLWAQGILLPLSVMQLRLQVQSTMPGFRTVFKINK